MEVPEKRGRQSFDRRKIPLVELQDTSKEQIDSLVRYKTICMDIFYFKSVLVLSQFLSLWFQFNSDKLTISHFKNEYNL